MTRPSGAPRQPQKKERNVRLMALVSLVALVVLFLAGWAGWAIHAATHQAKAVHVSRVFTGTVSLVGNGGSSGCVKPDSGKAVCTNFYLEAGASALKVGRKVHAAEEWASDGSGGSSNLLLIYSATWLIRVALRAGGTRSSR